ncbi:MAG: PQQ-binding-like beta-propeller repeat protein, partial [Actinobacteria bacterium]|nr:PQQ-binding-like beta-propeller repeat protein [Actinomycetota bacterium]
MRRLLALVLSSAVLAGCAGDDRPRAQEAPRPQPRPVTDPPRHPPLRPVVPASVRVIDGDTKRPVKGAAVHLGRFKARAEARGVAEFELPRYRRFDVRVAKRGYIARSVSIRFRRREARATVRIWERSTQWPIYGATPARTQAHPAIKLRPPFRIAWHRWIRSLLEFPAVVWEGVAYVNTYRGDTVAVSMENGRILWRRKVGTTFASSPAVEPERRELVVTTKVPGRATILDMRTGRIKWRYDTGRAEPSPVIANRIAYFGDEDGRMYALDLRRRRARWVYSGGVKITASPALVRGRLYFGDYAGRVTALNARTGRRIWTGSAGS